MTELPKAKYELTHNEAFDLETLLLRISQGFTIPHHHMPDFYTHVMDKMHSQFNRYMDEHVEELNILYDLENEPASAEHEKSNSRARALRDYLTKNTEFGRYAVVYVYSVWDKYSLHKQCKVEVRVYIKCNCGDTTSIDYIEINPGINYKTFVEGWTRKHWFDFDSMFAMAFSKFMNDFDEETEFQPLTYDELMKEELEYPV